MKRKKRSFFFWLSLLAYGLLLTGALLYFRYPATKVNRYLAAKVSTFAQGVKIEIGRCGYGVPMQVRCENLRLIETETGDELVLIDTISASPILSGFGLKYMVDGELADGSFTAAVGIVPRQGRVELKELVLADVNLARLPILKKNMQREISGLAGFHGTVTITRQGTNVSRAKLLIHEGSLPFRQQILLVEQQQMAPLEVELAYADGRVQLTNGTVKGGPLSFTFSGEIQSRDGMANWEMNIAGNIVPSQQYVATNPAVQRLVRRLQRQFQGETLPYMLSGNMRMPRFRFGGR